MSEEQARQRAHELTKKALAEAEKETVNLTPLKWRASRLLYHFPTSSSSLPTNSMGVNSDSSYRTNFYINMLFLILILLILVLIYFY